VHDSHYSSPSASCLHVSHAVDVAACRGRDISWYASHGMRFTLQWSYCSLACDAIVMLHGVTGGPATSRGLEIWCQVYRHAGEMGVFTTVLYCSQDNSRASTDRGSLTRCICAAPRRSCWRRVQSILRLIICVYGCDDPAVLIISIRLIFGCTIRPNTNSAFFHYSVPNRIR